MKRTLLSLALLAMAAQGVPVGTDEVTISSPAGGTARINLFGAVVTSWVPAGGTEVFAMAKPYAACTRGEQIHGGLPMCWPWFVFEGPEKCRIHGLTRYFDWKVKARSADALTLELDDSPATRAHWPHAFHLELTYSFTGSALRAEFRATNTGSEPYACTEGFHPYFRVGELDACTVTGSDGTKYFWKGEIEKGDQRLWKGDFPCRLLGLGKPGYVFEEGPRRHQLKDPVLGRTLDITYENNLKFVLFGWTPDFSALGGSDDPAFGRHFVCVEGGTLYRDRAYVLRPGETHRLSVVVRATANAGDPCLSRTLVKGFNGAISPDGTTLAFQRDAGAETWLGLYDLRTGATTWAEKGPGRAAFPCWTRTGDLLYSYGNEMHTAFETWKGNLPEGYGIRLRGKDGTSRDVLVRGRWRDYSPCLSPDGRTLWFVTSRPPPGHPRANDFIGSCLAKEDLTGRAVVPRPPSSIVYWPSENWGTGVSQPVVSPDGKLLAWAELTTFALPWRIMAARVDDLAHPVTLTPADMAAYAPNWSPDGTLLTFTGCRGDDPGWYVYVLDPALNRLRRVCLGENSSFAPDGKGLVYDRDGTVYLRPFGAADRPTANDPLAKPADAFPWKEAETILYAGTNFTRTAQVPLPSACAFGDEQTFFVRAKVDWDGDASRFQVMTFGRYTEHPLGFQLYFALNGRPHVGTRDANGYHVCLHTREPLAKAGVYEITGIRSKGRLWLYVDDGGRAGARPSPAEPICAEFGDGLIALDHPQQMVIGSGLLPKSHLLSLEVGRGWPANVPVPQGGGLNDWRNLQ